MAEIKRYEGTVKWFRGQKGFGFIAPADGDGDLFVHQTEIKAEGFRFLKDGQRVEFSVGSGGDGRKMAVDVVGLGRSYPAGPRRGVRGRRGGYGSYRGSVQGGRFGRSAVRGGGGGRIGGPECYNCGRVGHLARDCYRGSDCVDGNEAGYDHDHGGDGDGDGGGGGGSRSKACYHCGEEGHFARDCRNDQD